MSWKLKKNWTFLFLSLFSLVVIIIRIRSWIVVDVFLTNPKSSKCIDPQSEVTLFAHKYCESLIRRQKIWRQRWRYRQFNHSKYNRIKTFNQIENFNRTYVLFLLLHQLFSLYTIQIESKYCCYYCFSSVDVCAPYLFIYCSIIQLLCVGS